MLDPITIPRKLDQLELFNCVQGADAPISGLIAMLAAAEILGNSSQASSYEKRVVFLALAGEPWGYMGSKRFLWELHTGENSTAGLTLEAVELVGFWHGPYISQSHYMGSKRSMWTTHSHKSSRVGLVWDDVEAAVPSPL